MDDVTVIHSNSELQTFYELFDTLKELNSNSSVNVRFYDFDSEIWRNGEISLRSIKDRKEENGKTKDRPKIRYNVTDSLRLLVLDKQIKTVMGIDTILICNSLQKNTKERGFVVIKSARIIEKKNNWLFYFNVVNINSDESKELELELEDLKLTQFEYISHYSLPGRFAWVDELLSCNIEKDNCVNYDNFKLSINFQKKI